MKTIILKNIIKMKILTKQKYLYEIDLFINPSMQSTEALKSFQYLSLSDVACRWAGPYLRSLDHLGRSSGVKK